MNNDDQNNNNVPVEPTTPDNPTVSPAEQTPPAPQPAPESNPYGAAPQPIAPVQPTTPPPIAPAPSVVPNTTPGGPGKANTGLIVGIIVAAAIIIAGGVAAFMLLSDNGKTNNAKTGDNNSQQNDVSDDLRAANAKTVSTLTQFNTVCDTGSVTNAANFEKPYKVAAFSKSSVNRSWGTVSLEYGAEYAADYDDYEATNVVACLSEIEGSATKSQTCDFKSGGENVSVDYYAVQYNLTVYEAKSGKKIQDLGSIGGPATSCPSFVTYNREDPKIHANPDRDAVSAAIAKFAE